VSGKSFVLFDGSALASVANSYTMVVSTGGWAFCGYVLKALFLEFGEFSVVTAVRELGFGLSPT